MDKTMIKLWRGSGSAHRFNTMGTETAGFFFRPSRMSNALSPYILWMALRWTTSEEPPIVLSRRNLACSSADIRDIFRCTVSRTLMVARLVSRTTSSCAEDNTGVSSSPWQCKQQEDSGVSAKSTRLCCSPRSVHLHSGRCAPRTESSWSWQTWSLQTRRGRTPRCHSGPEQGGVVKMQLIWRGTVNTDEVLNASFMKIEEENRFL